MKLFIGIIFGILCISSLYAEEYKELSYNWIQIKIPNNDIPLMSLITEKNDLLILCDTTLYLSNDYGKSFKNYRIDTYFQIYSYQYDINNGLYLICDRETGVKIPIYYLKPERDSLIPLSFLGGDYQHIYKKYQFENNLMYQVNYTENINNHHLLIGTKYQVWLFDIITKKNSPIKYIDDIIQHLIQKDSIQHFSINFIKVNKWTNRIDIYYELGKEDFHIYSTNLGITWSSDTYPKDCIPYRDQIFLSYAQWNKKDRWFLPYPFKNSIRTIDTNCNVFHKELSVKFGAGISWIAVAQASCNAIDSMIVLPTHDNRILYSKDYGQNFDIINNVPFEYYIYNSMNTQVFRNGEILIFLWKYNEKTSEVYIGDPKSVSVNNQSVAGNMIIYPNPAGNFITLSESDTKLYTNYEIYDINGRLLQKAVLDNYRIDISALERGSYYLRLLSPSGIATAGFLKME